MPAPTSPFPVPTAPERPGVPVATGLTVADLDDRPERHQDGLRVELVHGELFVSPPPIRRHQGAVVAIASALHVWTRRHGGAVYPAPVGWYVDARSWVEPDVVFLGPAAAAHLSDPRHVDVVPDLVVEVSSPSTRRLDLIKKRGLYEATGVPTYWFVDLDESVVDVYEPDTTGHYGTPATFGVGAHLDVRAAPGLRLAVAEVLGVHPPTVDDEPTSDGAAPNDEA
ncbi:Uma2 family endonuclease [Nitriliruptoraceae bacterium ZYF776]|nr:Uma2 family endonuclease [Profundirhabdus halotolerans]